MLQWQQKWRQVEACWRYVSRQRLAGGMEAGRGLQPYRMYDRKQSKACRRYGAARGLQEV